jgi:drug/metabolite transporter (DMT)-like permease
VVFVRNALYIGAVMAACLLHWRCEVRPRLRTLDSATVLASIFLAAQSLAVVVGCALTSVANVALIINTTPVFCVTFDRIFLKETIRRRTAVMVCRCLCGVGIILGGDYVLAGASDPTVDGGVAFPHAAVGNLVALLNPLSWACYWTILRLRHRVNSLTYLLHCCSLLLCCTESRAHTSVTPLHAAAAAAAAAAGGGAGEI